MTTDDVGGWRERAACLGLPSEWFVDSHMRKEAIRRAKGICRGCPVIAECFTEALGHSNHEDIGVWGGTHAKERKEIRREIERQSAGSTTRDHRGWWSKPPPSSSES